ncbi:similar to Saccharomyces cerevisiae YHR050W SMF2 Divalent metal ion transporter involved in manganese homeostasis [Maudiozyma saulgeensis]|uniref:Similar to Saccharomyces cerevisiae YHR050W SMF2 Divalent metal ion transporter involved in manganese homeostasis n=1 Tax=Maudiozyma saulgeensis TaxID=1789683 RepID=A0A1X7QZ25_9SACH|nr:similar to Saccharomyces cerevisiae YHR050W SMF2 Divalent metal ion transporter involved in manganese homeostasis [Kazachstania saulgeensis]
MVQQRYEHLATDESIETNETSTKDNANDNGTTTADVIDFVRPTSLNSGYSHDDSKNRIVQVLLKYMKFVGPGLMVSVSYMDPGNYSTAVAAGSAHRYKLLFSILVSNFMAAFWQCLCAKLGAVTGLDLAQNCKKHLPFGLNIALYILAEIAIVATDLAEVVGTAISLNILFDVPLALGVVLTVIDVLIVLMAYKPNGSMKWIRIFEAFVSFLVVMTVICFGIELFYADLGPAKEIFKGFLPSRAVIDADGLYLSLAILGATVMPHSLYLGSGVVQPRLRDYDINKGYYKPDMNDIENNHDNYKPSFEAINETLHYTMAELLVSLFTVALFVNCSILIVSGATLYGTTQNSEEADLFSIYNLLCSTLSKSAGTIFVVALLFSGQSSGIVCTLSGQMVSEGFLNWTIAPALRRSATRAVAITPCLILVLVAGRNGLSGALNASQVVLSLLLPFVSAPLLYFTSNKKIMRVQVNGHNDCQQPSKSSTGSNNKSIPFNDEGSHQDEFGADESIELQDLLKSSPKQTDTNIVTNTDDITPEYKDMSNSLFTTIAAIAVWLLVSVLNFYMLVSFASNQEVHV